MAGISVSMRNHKKCLLFIVNVDWFFISHRLPLALAALADGFEVHVATTLTEHSSVLRESGVIVHPITMHRSSSSVLLLMSEFISIASIIRKTQPDLLHLVTIKPVLFGGIASRILNVPAVVSAVSGLGYTFIDRGPLSFVRMSIVSILYRLAFGHKNQRVIFQNNNDLLLLSKWFGTKKLSSRSEIINGSGVDLSVFCFTPLPKQKPPVVMFASRLLADKGVREFVQASMIINESEKKARFVLVGEPDLLNPASIQKADLDRWIGEGVVEVWGHSDVMHKVLPKATIVSLPSYYGEGLPKILIEASACGRAIVTTDHPGCRDAIEDGVTGVLVPVRDAIALAEAISILIEQPDFCLSLGRAGRQRAEKLYDVNEVVASHITIYKHLLD